MPGRHPGLNEWLTLLTQPGVILVGVGLFVNQLNKRIDDQKGQPQGSRLSPATLPNIPEGGSPIFRSAKSYFYLCRSQLGRV